MEPITPSPTIAGALPAGDGIAPITLFIERANTGPAWTTRWASSSSETAVTASMWALRIEIPEGTYTVRDAAPVQRGELEISKEGERPLS